MTVTVFRNGPVFRADAAGSWATAVAVVDDRIAAVGGDADVAAHLAGADDVVDLEGRLLVPGFHDAHVHPVMGGIERLRCDLSQASTQAGYVAAVAAYAAAHPDEPWVRGGGWDMAAFDRGVPTRHSLDAVCPERPVVLPNRDGHSAWVNTRALELAGIDRHTPDPPDGRIERDEHGEPTGALHEGALALVEDVAPADTLADQVAGLRIGQEYLHSVGVVGWQDAIVHVRDAPTMHDAYLQAQTQGWLTARVQGALWWDRDIAADGIAERVAHFARVRDDLRGHGGRYRTENVKVMVDGVIETFTAAMLEPYLDRCRCEGGNRGISFLEPELLHAVVDVLDAAGFGVHFHAIGDRAVRDALDAVAAARRARVSADHRHHLAHLQVVHPDDLPRFRRLGVAANLQALWAAHEAQMDELTIPFLGPDRTSWQYPFGDLHRDGATLAMGSDWPVSTADPLAAIHVAVNRRVPGSPDAPPLGAEQALPLATALRAYTAGSAWVNRVDDVSGTVAVGRAADLVVLDRNPFDGPPSAIGDTVVHRTYVGGQLVHHAG